MPKTPGYRKRHDRNQAIVTLTDAVTKKRRDYWLGEPDSPERRELYHRVIAEWEANGRRLFDPDFEKPAADGADGDGGITISELCARFQRAGAAPERERVRALQGADPPAAPRVRLHARGEDNETREQWRKRLASTGLKADHDAWRKEHSWFPHQLRHTAATLYRREHGLEASALVLGHASARVTDAVYAERDQTKVSEIMRLVG